MKTIHKFMLYQEATQTLLLPKGYEILSVGEQLGNLFVWVMVDSDLSPTEYCYIRVYGTGEPIDTLPSFRQTHLGTVMMSSGLVWHLFELK